jgi:hypothetical protein
MTQTEIARAQLNTRLKTGGLHLQTVDQKCGPYKGCVIKWYKNDTTGRMVGEVYERGRARVICAPPTPFVHLLCNRDKPDKYYRVYDYGRFLRLAAQWLV